MPPSFVSPRDKGDCRSLFSYRSGRRPTWKIPYLSREEYTYQVGKIHFIVTPVYKDKGESMRDILLKLMLADLEPA